MIRDISRLENKTFDVLIVGGGINGAAIAHLAAACGASVALLEKDDFAAGTSSRSSKLLHGGIRYLEHFEFDLVAESLRERALQLKTAPHLTGALRFVIPVYKDSPRPLWMMKVGVRLYDLLSGRDRLGLPRYLSTEDVVKEAPGISREGLTGGVEYWDAQMDDARLCLENVLMADTFGAVAANNVEVEQFILEAGRAVGVQARDRSAGRSFAVKGRTVILAAGPWSDSLIRKLDPAAPRRLRPTKGVHIVYQGQVSSSAFLLQGHSDGRVFFVIPYKGHTLIGTTDTDYTGDPGSVSVEEEDLHYLLTEAARVFPRLTFERSRILSSFAGVRPLVAEKGHPSKVSRRHVVERLKNGAFAVMGGKYTTYRAIAEDTLRLALPDRWRCRPPMKDYILFGSGSLEKAAVCASRYGLSADTVAYLQGVYGSRAEDVLALTHGRPELKAVVCSCSPAIAAQVVYARDVEMARDVDDVLERRLGVSYLGCRNEGCRQRYCQYF
ncbi:MAG: glycerol-3-phosphate dehydrogenase/oxidase [Candidatus Omnitrophota bacterium]